METIDELFGMKTTVKRTIKVTIEMSEEEAKWLREVSRNPLGYSGLEMEPEESRKIRESFFRATTFALDGQ